MSEPVKNLLYFLLLLLCLHSGAQTDTKNTPRKYCDSLIEAGINKMRVGEYLASLEILTQAHAIAEKNNWQKQLFLAKNYIGSDYSCVLEYGEALNYYLPAYIIANKLGPRYQMMIINNIAILYSKNKDYGKAKAYFTKARDISVKEKDNEKLGICELNLGVMTSSMEDLPAARKHFESALELSQHSPLVLYEVKIAIAEMELKEGHPEKAIQQSMALLDMKRVARGENNAITLLLIISKSYLKLQNFPKASEYAELAYRNNTNLETKKTIFEILSDIQVKNNKFPEALRLKDSIIILKDTLEEIRNGRLFENNRVKFEMQDYKNQISLNKTTIANERRIFYTILTSVLAILILVILILRNLSVKHKHKKLIAENNEQIIKLELEQKNNANLLLEKQFREEQTHALLEQEKLKSEIEYKNRKLSVNALYLSRKNENIDEMLRLLSNLPEAAKDQSVKNHINFLKRDARTDNEWESFVTHFEEVNQGFLTRLKTKHTDLTVNDIRFICYVFMNLSSKEIASMLSITLDACRKRKERVATKLGLADSGDLYGYLSGI